MPKNSLNERDTIKALVTEWLCLKGGYYADLKEQYIIFLCPMDIFKRGLPFYHFENRAREDSCISLNDRT